jgi:hypothetical protein
MTDYDRSYDMCFTNATSVMSEADLIKLHAQDPERFKKLQDDMAEVSAGKEYPVRKEILQHEPNERTFKAFMDDPTVSGVNDMSQFLCMKIDKLEDAIAALKS